MLSLILSNIRLVGIIAAIITCFGAGAWVDKQFSNAKLERELKAQETRLIEQCNADKKLTSEVDHAYQQKITTLSNRVVALKRMSTNACVSITGASAIANGSTTTGHAGMDAIPMDSLIDYAAQAEKQRQQLIGLQDFINKVWQR